MTNRPGRRDKNLSRENSGQIGTQKKSVIIIIIYENLTVYVKRMWNLETKMIPVITGATGTISKSLKQYLSFIPGKHEVKKLQTTAIFGTAHKLRKVLM
jgi:hypothetical protein